MNPARPSRSRRIWVAAFWVSVVVWLLVAIALLVWHLWKGEFRVWLTATWGVSLTGVAFLFRESRKSPAPRVDASEPTATDVASADSGMVAIGSVRFCGRGRERLCDHEWRVHPPGMAGKLVVRPLGRWRRRKGCTLASADEPLRVEVFTRGDEAACTAVRFLWRGAQTDPPFVVCGRVCHASGAPEHRFFRPVHGDESEPPFELPNQPHTWRVRVRPRSVRWGRGEWSSFVVDLRRTLADVRVRELDGLKLESVTHCLLVVSSTPLDLAAIEFGHAVPGDSPGGGAAEDAPDRNADGLWEVTLAEAIAAARRSLPARLGVVRVEATDNREVLVVYSGYASHVPDGLADFIKNRYGVPVIFRRI